MGRSTRGKMYESPDRYYVTYEPIDEMNLRGH